MEQIVQRPARRVVTARRGLCVALTVALMSGCASAPSVVPVTRGESVALVVVKAADVDGPGKIDNLSLGTGATTGLGSGLVVGAASGLGCGPFAFVCVPVGMFVGGLAGWGGGAVVGLTGALPDEKAAQLRQRVAQSLTTHDLLADLGNQVTDRASKILGTVCREASLPTHAGIEQGRPDVHTRRGDRPGRGGVDGVDSPGRGATGRWCRNGSSVSRHRPMPWAPGWTSAATSSTR